MNRRNSNFPIAALVIELKAKAGGEVQLFPAGDFRATDGRPHEVPAWHIDAAIAEQVIAAANARRNQFAIDYEHQTLHTEENGQPAPAAGWFKPLVWRDDGLYATDVAWTARAKQMIEADPPEYRYLSPVFRYDPKTGAVREILMAAITNTAGIDGMAELAARAAAKFDFSEEENAVMKAMIEILDLSPDASEADVLAAMRAMKKKVGDMEEKVASMKTQTPDPAKFVSIETMKGMQDELTALKSSLAQRDLDEVVGQAIEGGKLLPAQEKWARDLGKTNIAALKEYIASAQPLPALRGMQTGGKLPGAAAGGDPVATAKAKFESDATIREEFGTIEVYTAWCKADASGKVKILGRQTD